MMENGLQFYGDDKGVAIVGDDRAVRRFLGENWLHSRDLGLGRLRKPLAQGSAVAQGAAEITSKSGRWLKLTEESANKLKKSRALQAKDGSGHYADLVTDGKITDKLKFVKEGSLSLTNPAVLTGIAGIMAQAAMQQTMDEITNYLDTIDSKCDDILRSQRDAVYADMIGVGMVLDDAMLIRGEVGHVSEVTWSKIQGSSQIIARTQAYAIEQLRGLAEKLENDDVGDLADSAQETEKTVNDWLVVLARSFQLQDALAVLEIDRVLDAGLSELDAHRQALDIARKKRLAAVSDVTTELVSRVNEAIHLANRKVLLNPSSSRKVVRSGSNAVEHVSRFHNHLDIDHEHNEITERKWLDAAVEIRDKAWAAGNDRLDRAKRVGSEGLDTAKRLGNESLGRAKSLSARAAQALENRRQSRHDEQQDPDDDHGE